MPLNPLSDRQSTVAYGSDLLRAHKICRENAILQKQLMACLDQVATLCDEVRDLKANNISAIQAERTARTFLEAQVQALSIDSQNIVAAQQQQARHVQVTLESFHIALDEKADASVVESLKDQVDQLRINPLAVDATLPPVSRVSESVQVLDSQQHNHREASCISPAHADRLKVHHGPHETVPDDLDLDANADMISYAGHHQYFPNKNDSLNMLPPSTAGATQLARIKTLRQRRFDEWTSYYDQGLRLLKSLPNNFEETVVRNFAGGIFNESHKKQCQEWLDANGWTWTNVTTFGDLCSQVLANNAIQPVGHKQALSSPPRQMEDMPATARAKHRTERPTDIKMAQKPNTRRATGEEPLRRSQRLVEKDRLHTSSHEIPAPVAKAVHPTKANPPNSSAHASDLSSNTRLRAKSEALAKKKKPQPNVAEDKQVPRVQQHQAEDGSAKLRVADVNLETAVTRQLSALSTRKRDADLIRAVHPKKRLKSEKDKTGNLKDVKSRVLSAKQEGAKVAGESSDDEGFLYKANYADNLKSSRAGDVLRKRRSAKLCDDGAQRQHRTARKQQRLPLPPPPEIPILPTTDEE
jgi:hypothetical protein